MVAWLKLEAHFHFYDWKSRSIDVAALFFLTVCFRSAHFADESKLGVNSSVWCRFPLCVFHLNLVFNSLRLRQCLQTRVSQSRPKQKLDNFEGSKWTWRVHEAWWSIWFMIDSWWTLKFQPWLPEVLEPRTGEKPQEGRLAVEFPCEYVEYVR